jgi:hypothetical protein
VCSSPSGDVSSHSATGSIESAFTSANSTTNLSVATADLIFGDALPSSLVDSPRLERVIELSKLVPSSYRMPDRKAMNGTYFPEPYTTRARKRDARVLEIATDSKLFGVFNFIHLPAFVVHELILRSCHLLLFSPPMHFSLFCFNFC